MMLAKLSPTVIKLLLICEQQDKHLNDLQIKCFKVGDYRTHYNPQQCLHSTRKFSTHIAGISQTQLARAVGIPLGRRSGG